MADTAPSPPATPSLTVLWAAKGGAGTTTVAAALALATPGDTLLVDLDGDLPAVLGIPEPSGEGIADWLQHATPAATLADLTVDVNGSTRLLPRGHCLTERLSPRWREFAAWATTQPAVIVDAGTGRPPPELHDAGRSLLVTRACYLALRDAVAAHDLPDAIVLVNEPGRALRAGDVERALAQPVIAQVDVDPAIARAIDSGLLAARLPRLIERQIRAALPPAAEPQSPTGTAEREPRRLHSVASIERSGDGFRPVTVEVHVGASGLPGYHIVGLADAAQRTSRDRVRAAFLNSGLAWPDQAITINVAPAGRTNLDPTVDLAVAAGILAATGRLDRAAIDQFAYIGELGLDGTVRHTPGEPDHATVLELTGRPPAGTRHLCELTGHLPASPSDPARHGQSTPHVAEPFASPAAAAAGDGPASGPAQHIVAPLAPAAGNHRGLAPRAWRDRMKWLQRLRGHRSPPPALPGQFPQRDHWLAADRRRHAVEVHYGDHWTFDDPGDPYSMIWNPGHGELYTLRHQTGTVAVIGVFPTRDEVDAVLAGWADLENEPLSGYRVSGRVGEHLAQQRQPDEPCYAVVLRVDGTAQPLDRPVTDDDIQTALGGVALATADDVGLSAGLFPSGATLFVDRNAHRDLRPPNDAATSMCGGRWPIRGDVVITSLDRQRPLDPATVAPLLRLPRPADPTAPPHGPRLDIAAIRHSDWLDADPRRRNRGEHLIGTSVGPDPDYELTFNNGSHELYLLNRRTGDLEVLGIFDDNRDAADVVHRWSEHISNDRDNHGHRSTFTSGELDWLRHEAARSSIPIERDVAHDVALATHSQAVAADHNLTVQFRGGRHQPVEFWFGRPAVDSTGTVWSELVEPASTADIDAALADFLHHRSPDKVELDPTSDWAKAERDFRDAAIDAAQHGQAQGWFEVALHPEVLDRNAAEATSEPDDATATPATPTPATSPAKQILAHWQPSPGPPADVDHTSGLGGIA